VDADAVDADAPSHESAGVALAREAAALDGIPDQDVAFEEALADHGGVSDR